MNTNKLLMENKLKVGFAAAFVLLLLIGSLMGAGKPVASEEKQVQQTRIEKTAGAASSASKSAASKNTPVWQVRCNEQPDSGEELKGRCEVYQRLVVQETGQRVAELAIGFPDDKKSGRGAIVLPLGMSLPEGGQMKIDGGQSFKFNMRYCKQDGCYAFLTINEALLAMLRKGKKAELAFKLANGQMVNIELSLSGFSKAVDAVSGS